jgi:CBS domain containing-hemolysin-like protein
MITQIIILVVLLFLSAFFSGVETALMSLNMVKVKTLVEQKRKGSSALHRIKQNPRKLLITILIGNNLVNIGSAALATVVFTDIFGSSGAGIATGVMTFLILIFGEITPKTFATQNAERIALVIARPVEIMSASLLPVVKIFEHIAELMLKIFKSKEQEELSEEELKTIVTMGKEEGLLSEEAAEIMHNVLEFKGTKVTKVMTPKSVIQMINAEAPLRDELDFIVKTPFSMYPVYRGTRDKVVGMVDVEDVLRYTKENKLDEKIENFMRTAIFVPESKEIDDLLSDFEGVDMPLAVVVDEYGNVSGLVTMEDILEEIVGEIFDKSDRESVYIKKVDANLVRVDAKASIEEINRVLHLGLEEGQFATIAGFIEHKLKRIPKKGEEIKLKRVTIAIEDVDNQKIKSVKIIRN